MSTNLGMTDVLASQNQKEVTINANRSLLDQLLTVIPTQTVDNTNAVTLSTTQFRDNVGIVLANAGSPPTAQVTVTVPAISRGLYVIKNTMTQDALITISGQSEPAPIVSAGQVGLIHTGGVNIRGFEAGVSNFLSLSDTPSSFVGNAGKAAIVNVAENALEFSNVTVQAKLDSSSFKQNFKGALVERSTNLSIVNVTDVQPAWETVPYDTTFSNDDNVTNQKFWLGVDLTFTANVNDNLTATAHGMTTGDGPLRVTTSGTLPAPLAISTNYWVIRIDDNTIQLATSRANALSGTQIDITTIGTGTHTLDRATRLIVPAGVTRVKLHGGVRFADPGTSEDQPGFLSFQKNESFVFDGRAEDAKTIVGTTDGDDVTSFNVTTPSLIVTGGDFFELNVRQETGGALNALAGNFTFFAIEVIESDVVIPFPQVMVEKPFKGAVLELTANQLRTHGETFTQIDWDQAAYDTGHNGINFAEFVTNPNRITIPTGVTKVRFKCHISCNTDMGTSQYFALFISKATSSVYPGRLAIEIPTSTLANGTDLDITGSTAVLEVTAGDWFDLRILSSDLSFTINTNSWFSIEVVETTEILTFPGVSVERPHIGAIVTKSGSQALTSGVAAKVTFDTTTYDTGFKGTALFVDASDHFLIPAGVTKIRLWGSLQGTATSLTSFILEFRKNGGGSPVGLSSHEHTASSGTNEFLSIASPVIEVVAGDTLELYANITGTTPSITTNAIANAFAIEIVETTDAAFPPEEVTFFINGTPAISDMIYQKVASRRFSMSDDLASSRAYAVTAPSASTAFDVQKNGVSIGTITFAMSANTATFVTAGATQEDFDPGDRLSIHSPANLNSMADIAFNLFAFRT